jgi:hypothetical protein
VLYPPAALALWLFLTLECQRTLLQPIHAGLSRPLTQSRCCRRCQAQSHAGPAVWSCKGNQLAEAERPGGFQLYQVLHHASFLLIQLLLSRSGTSAPSTRPMHAVC